MSPKRVSFSPEVRVFYPSLLECLQGAPSTELVKGEQVPKKVTFSPEVRVYYPRHYTESVNGEKDLSTQSDESLQPNGCKQMENVCDSNSLGSDDCGSHPFVVNGEVSLCKEELTKNARQLVDESLVKASEVQDLVFIPEEWQTRDSIQSVVECHKDGPGISGSKRVSFAELLISDMPCLRGCLSACSHDSPNGKGKDVEDSPESECYGVVNTHNSGIASRTRSSLNPQLVEGMFSLPKERLFGSNDLDNDGSLDPIEFSHSMGLSSENVVGKEEVISNLLAKDPFDLVKDEGSSSLSVKRLTILGSRTSKRVSFSEPLVMASSNPKGVLRACSQSGSSPGRKKFKPLVQVAKRLKFETECTEYGTSGLKDGLEVSERVSTPTTGYLWSSGCVLEGTTRMLRRMLRIHGCEPGGYTYFTMFYNVINSAANLEESLMTEPSFHGCAVLRTTLGIDCAVNLMDVHCGGARVQFVRGVRDDITGVVPGGWIVMAFVVYIQMHFHCAFNGFKPGLLEAPD